jgi:hypothetical protein
MRTSIEQLTSGGVAAGILLALGMNTAGANNIVLTPDAVNKIFFNNFENVFDASGQYKAPGLPLEPGDHLVGILNVQNIEVGGATSFFSGPQDQLTGIFARRILAILPPPDPFGTQVTEPHVILAPPAVTTFCWGDDCFDTGLSGNEMIALYRDTGATATSFESNGSLADDVAKATDGTPWLTLGHTPGPDGAYGTADDDGYFYGHTDGQFPPPDEAYAGLNAILNNTGFAFFGVNDVNEGEIGGFELLNDVVLTSEIEVNLNGTLLGGNSPWQTASNDPATIWPYVPDEPLGCRFTGGGVDTSTSVPTWDGTFEEGEMPMSAGVNRYQFGGQAGANTGAQPQPKGEWTHHQQTGPSGSFTFHGGTASAPQGTEIDEIRCSDPGFCFPARPAPAKQLDFDGIGTFKNIGKGKNAPTWFIPGANVTAEGNGNKTFDGTFHWFEVNVDDAGEPGNENSGKNDASVCPVDGFGEKGSVALVNCDCPDFYRITIYDGVNAANVLKNPDGSIDPTSLNQTDVIYEVFGYIDGGNLQLHPPTGFDTK